MNPNYFSFLICFHEKQIDIYYNGLTVGHVIDGVFSLHEFKMPDGNSRPLTLNDLHQPCPFNSIEELKVKVISTVSLMR